MTAEAGSANAAATSKKAATNKRGNIRRHQRNTLAISVRLVFDSVSFGVVLLYLSFAMAKDNLYQAVYQGSGTFLITKPKRKAAKRRQSKLKGTVRGARKS